MSKVEADGLGDWRIQAATRLAADLPAAYEGGPSHKAGSPMYQSMRTSTKEHENFGFITPNAAALAISAAMHAAEHAASLWNEVKTKPVATPDGSGTSITFEATPLLFDYFEFCLMAANSSFQAIEAYCNQTISRTMAQKTLWLDRKGVQTEFTSEQIERQISTEEKIATVLPMLSGLRSIKGRHEWQLFKKLKDVRDASVHFKSDDQYPKQGKAGEGSLYHALLNAKPTNFPTFATRIIAKLHPQSSRPRWLVHMIEIYRLD